MTTAVLAPEDDTDALLSELLALRRMLNNKAVTVLLDARTTPAAYPLAQECVAICGLDIRDVAIELKLFPRSLETMLRMECPDQSLLDDFVDAVIMVLEREDPYKWRADTVLAT